MFLFLVTNKSKNLQFKFKLNVLSLSTCFIKRLLDITLFKTFAVYQSQTQCYRAFRMQRPMSCSPARYFLQFLPCLILVPVVCLVSFQSYSLVCVRRQFYVSPRSCGCRGAQNAALTAAAMFVCLLVSGASGRNEPSRVSLPHCWTGKYICP